MGNYRRQSKTYTFYTDIIGNFAISKRAYYLRRWQGPIFQGKYQHIMCYDKPTLFKLLRLYQEANVTIYLRRQVGLNAYEFKPLSNEELEEQIERLYQEIHGFKKEFTEPTSIEEVTRFTKGWKPRYGKGTGKGDANCNRCGQCVCSLLKSEDKVVGWFHTTCRCGDDIDYSEAHLYL